MMTAMLQVDSEVDRYLTLLGDKIRGRGFTQLEVQQALGWGRSYISQLVTKQKSLRLDQVLLILGVIGIEPADFFTELYHPQRFYASAPARPDPGQAMVSEELPRLKAYVQSVQEILVQKGLVGADELEEIAADARRGAAGDDG